MKHDGRKGDEPESVDGSKIEARIMLDHALAALSADQTASDADQTASDADQTASDADQTASDADQTASDADQTASDADQRASGHDQEVADRDHAARIDLSAADLRHYETSREERRKRYLARLRTQLRRVDVTRERDVAASARDQTATTRDRIADARDAAARARDASAAELERMAAGIEGEFVQPFERLRLRAAADRARAAADREHAARDRADAARERAQLETELRSAHLDALTGAYRRELGWLALSHEIERARRSDGRFVVAFVDVDGLKCVNDRDGHAAGDRVLQAVVHAIGARLRSFDPIIRYGGDEFVCGLSRTDLAEAERRFEAIRIAVEADAGVGISIGLAALRVGDTADQLVERADAAMLDVKVQRPSGRRQGARN